MLEPLELSDMSQQPQVSTAAAMETANSSKKAVAAGGVGSNDNKTPSKSLKSGQLQEHSMDSSREILAVPALLGANNSSHTSGKNAEPTMQNGKLLTTVYPSNSHCAWLIPPRYDSKSIPNILLVKGVALPAQTFTEIITRISSDLRFFSYAVLHSRITPLWLIFSIIILLVVLASSPSGGFPIMVFALVWLLMLVFGLIMCLLIRKYIVLSLRNLMREVNKVALQHRILVGIQDNGHLSCQKVAIMMVYYNTAGCREDLAKLLRIHRANPNLFSPSAAQPSHQAQPSPTAVDQQQLVDEANELLCLYSQAYAKAYMKKRFLFPTRPAEGVSDFRPKHCQKSICLCQYVEREHFEQKAARKAAPWYERAFAV